MPTIPSFEGLENKHDVSKDCIKKFYESLIGHAMRVIGLKKNKMKLLRNKQLKSYENANICYTCKEKFEDKYIKDTK